MNTVWKLQDAKSRFSEVVEDALRIGPQYVSRRGVEAVVVLAATQYEALVSKKPGLADFLLTCPAVGDELVFERQKDMPRSIDL
jgi:antitoxin Phd